MTPALSKIVSMKYERGKNDISNLNYYLKTIINMTFEI